jgi:hypothetical protein
MEGSGSPYGETEEAPANSRASGPREVFQAVLFLLLPLIGVLQQTVVPVTLAVNVYLSGGESALFFGGISAALCAFVALILLLGPWLPGWLMAIPILSLAAIPAGLLRWDGHRPALPSPGAAQEWAMGLLMWGIAAWLALNAVRAWRGTRPLPGQPVDLALPLGPGRYVALQAGSSRLVNRHLTTLEKPSLFAIRGQAFAVDIIALHPGDIPARPPFSRRAMDYAIFGMEVRSPVRGRVAAMCDGIVDHDLFSTDRKNPLGNHVWLSVDDDGGRQLLILLAHLRRGSLRVQVGDTVEPGTPLGKVGHSGNSSEPHLHIHAQRDARPEAPLDADPVPMSFGDLGQLVRNQRFPVPA